MTDPAIDTAIGVDGPGKAAAAAADHDTTFETIPMHSAHSRFSDDEGEEAATVLASGSGGGGGRWKDDDVASATSESSSEASSEDGERSRGRRKLVAA